MNRQEFIQALRSELSKLPPEEIVDATQYFEECFDDACDGLDEEAALSEEARLIEEFGSPKKIAAQIKAEYAAKLLDGEASEGKKSGKAGKLSAIWWVIIGICSAPVAIPIVACAFAAAISIYALVLAGVISGIAITIFGLISIPGTVAGGIMTAGAGLMITAASLAATYAAFLGTVALARSISRSIKDANNRKKAKKYRNDEDVVLVTDTTVERGE